MKYVYEFGQRFDARVPRRDITWLVGRFHISKTDAEIEAWIRRRAKGTTDTLTNHCVRYALAVHHANQDLYHNIMTGRIG